jgi:hypothetical protein
MTPSAQDVSRRVTILGHRRVPRPNLSRFDLGVDEGVVTLVGEMTSALAARGAATLSRQH